MKDTQISTTALGIAAMRAIESEKPPEVRICYDPFARQLTSTGFYLLSKLFAGYGEKRAPGTQGFIVCRCRYFDDYLQQCLKGGIAQVVILGAGLDSRAYRVESAGGEVKYFEVDQPATQKSKIERIRRVFGTPPANVVYVPVDFNEESLDKLHSCGYDRSQRTVFLWEGVTYYLQPAAVDATLAWIRSNSAARSAILFDYIDAEALTLRQRGEIKRMQRYRGITGEGLIFGIEKGQIQTFLGERGFQNVVDADADELRRLYCTGLNRDRAVAGVYSIVHAET